MVKIDLIRNWMDIFSKQNTDNAIIRADQIPTLIHRRQYASKESDVV